MVNLDTRVGACGTLNDIYNKVCVSKKNKNLKSKRFKHDYMNKCIKNINKAYIMKI